MTRNILFGALALLIIAGVGLYSALHSEKGAPSDLKPIVFATDWKAQAEHGGFYQARAKGYYAEAGLNVKILPGGPNVNVPQLLATNSVQFGLGSNNFIPLNIVREKAGAKAVMATFQKDPQVLITHPRDDVKSIADMKGKPIMISDASTAAFWPWLKAKYGFEDSQIRKYTFNLAPFLTDKQAIQEGYLSSEPYTIETEGKIKPQVYLMADEGYPGYGAFIMTNTKLIEEQPEMVQAFVDASIRGWIDYLYGDPSPANELIKRDNPEMTDALLAHSIATLKEHGVIDSGDTATLGIGAMTDARWKEFFETMSSLGVFPKDLDYRQAYALDFINKGVGDDLKQELTAK